jgi:hypothetical protein
MKETVYCGERGEGGAAVWKTTVRDGEEIARRELPPRLDLRNHSPTGFEWGYGGSGPAQLALALLVDALGDAEEALTLYQPFKWQVVTNLPSTAWKLTDTAIREIAEELRLKRNAMEYTQPSGYRTLTEMLKDSGTPEPMAEDFDDIFDGPAVLPPWRNETTITERNEETI